MTAGKVGECWQLEPEILDLIQVAHKVCPLVKTKVIFPDQVKRCLGKSIVHSLESCHVYSGMFSLGNLCLQSLTWASIPATCKYSEQNAFCAIAIFCYIPNNTVGNIRECSGKPSIHPPCSCISLAPGMVKGPRAWPAQTPQLSDPWAWVLNHRPNAVLQRLLYYTLWCLRLLFPSPDLCSAALGQQLLTCLPPCCLS